MGFDIAKQRRPAWCGGGAEKPATPITMNSFINFTNKERRNG
jgi:hypothetical protein